MISPVDRPAFRVGDNAVSWTEVVDDAERRGALDALRAHVRAAAAAVVDQPPPGEAVRQAAIAFRRARGLLAGEELEAWLAHWAVTVGEWTAWTRREAAGVADDGPGGNVDADVDALLWPSAVCGGALGEWARRLALSRAVGDDAAVARLRAEAAAPSAVEREIQARHLDWTRLDAELLRFPTLDMAREALLCLTDDGMSPAEAATTAGVEVERVDACLEDLPPATRAALTGAQAGSVVPPSSDGEGFVVGLVRARTTPDAHDEAIVRRAVQTLGDRAVRRVMDEQVRWLDEV